MLFLKKIIQRTYHTALKRKYQTILLICILFILLNSRIIQLIEPDTFTHFSLAVWWTLTTMTTVGYGDISPATFIGQLWTILIVYPFGIGLFGIVIGIIVDSFSTYKRLKEEGKLPFKGADHIVIMGWTHKSKETIHDLLKEEEDHLVVCIDEMEKTPLVHDRFHFVQGKATDIETLKAAKIEAAKSVLIFAQDGIHNSELTDGKTLLIASAIEKYDTSTADNIFTIVEIIDKNHLQCFQHIKIDEFILSQQTISNLMAKKARESRLTRVDKP